MIHGNEYLHVELCGQKDTLSDALEFPVPLPQVTLQRRGEEDRGTERGISTEERLDTVYV